MKCKYNKILCKQCVDASLKSKVYSSGIISTALRCPSYYDEDGEYHEHNANKTVATYSCSNNHIFEQHILHECPNESCDWKQT